MIFILLTPTKSRMLQDMGHAGIVRRVRLEADGKDIVAVVARNVQVVRASLVMLQMQGRQFQLRHMFRPNESEAVELVTWFGILRQLSHGFSSRVSGVAQHDRDRTELIEQNKIKYTSISKRRTDIERNQANQN
jgi:hypothetical protein